MTNPDKQLAAIAVREAVLKLEHLESTLFRLRASGDAASAAELEDASYEVDVQKCKVERLTVEAGRFDGK